MSDLPPATAAPRFMPLPPLFLPTPPRCTRNKPTGSSTRKHKHPASYQPPATPAAAAAAAADACRVATDGLGLVLLSFLAGHGVGASQGPKPSADHENSLWPGLVGLCALSLIIILSPTCRLWCRRRSRTLTLS